MHNNKKTSKRSWRRNENVLLFLINSLWNLQQKNRKCFTTSHHNTTNINSPSWGTRCSPLPGQVMVLDCHVHNHSWKYVLIQCPHNSFPFQQLLHGLFSLQQQPWEGGILRGGRMRTKTKLQEWEFLHMWYFPNLKMVKLCEKLMKRCETRTCSATYHNKAKHKVSGQYVKGFGEKRLKNHRWADGAQTCRPLRWTSMGFCHIYLLS